MKFLVFKNRNEFYLGQYKEENNSIDRFDTPKGVAQNDGVTYLIGRELPPVIDKLSLNEVTLFAPIPRPKRNIFCVGKNYKAHAQEFSESGFDSSAAKSFINRRGLGKMRHIDIRDLWLQKEAREGRLDIYKILGKDNPSDLMTKILTMGEIMERLERLNIGLIK